MAPIKRRREAIGVGSVARLTAAFVVVKLGTVGRACQAGTQRSAKGETSVGLSVARYVGGVAVTSSLGAARVSTVGAA